MKNLFKKISCILLCLLFMLFSACNNSPDLYKRGIEITTIMGEMVHSEAYGEMVNIPHGIDMDLVKAKDYDTPIRAYKINVPTFESFVENTEIFNEEQLNKLSNNLKDQIENRDYFLYATTMLNNAYGPEGAVISSIFQASKIFDGKISSPIVYLYIFEMGKAIAVTFKPFGEKQFTAQGHFIFVEDLFSLSKVREVFEPFGCVVENLK